jgi:trk system potassium uptake protein
VPKTNLLDGLFKGLFHSISAFCNAGLDILKGNSLEAYSLDRVVNITIMILMQIGGLGFLVWEDISKCFGEAIKNKISISKAIKKLTLHTKIVLISQIMFVIFGTVLFLYLENDNNYTLGNLGYRDKILVSLFQSVSARMSGMSTVNIMKIRDTTKLLLMFLMFIGGAPGSMSGGIKTVTFVVIIYGMIAMIKGKKNITILKRTISHETYEKAMEIFICMISITFVSVFIVMNNLKETLPIIDITFDVVASITTVGLSVGAMEHMNDIGLLVNIILMYIGRVGTITTAVAFILGKPKENDDIVYAKEDVIVG